MYYETWSSCYLPECFHEPEKSSATLTVCVIYVLVDANRNMEFGVYFRLAPLGGFTGDFSKPSDKNNKGVFLTDNLGNAYLHTRVGGCAAGDIRAEQGKSKSCTGFFLFPQAKMEATSFAFHYSPVNYGGKYFVDGIILVHPT